MNAHNLGELRIFTAIQMNSMGSGFKTQRCKDYDDIKECPKGMAELLPSQRSFCFAQKYWCVPGTVLFKASQCIVMDRRAL